MDERNVLMTDERQKTINALFVDCWKLFKEFHFTKEELEKAKDDKRWNRCTEKAKQLADQYGRESMNIVFDTLELIENSEKVALRGISQYKLEPPVERKENEFE